MSFLNVFGYYIIPLALILGVLIFFHELGHFLVAKHFGVKVLKFSLGFGKKLVSRKWGETEYMISAFPLGGYVKMLGEHDDDDEPVSPSDEPRAFNNQHVLKRIAIVAAGPVFNLVLALLIFCCLFLVSGSDVLKPEVGQVRDDSPAFHAGFMKGDVIVAVDGRPIESWEEIKAHVKDKAGLPVSMAVRRGGEVLNLKVTPEVATDRNLFGEEVKSALIGIVASGKFMKIELGPWQAIKEGTLRTWAVTRLTFLTIVKLFQGVVSIKTVGGPIMIGQMTGQIAQESFGYLIPFLALISVNLGIINLLPVPILDGGVIVLLLVELILGRPLGLRKREAAQKMGLFLIAMLIAVVVVNDLSRIEVVRNLFQRLFG